MDFTSVAASATDCSDAANSLFGIFILRALCDAKTLACGGAYTSFSVTFSVAHPDDREKFPVEKRAAKMPKQHVAKWARLKLSS